MVIARKSNIASSSAAAHTEKKSKKNKKTCFGRGFLGKVVNKAIDHLPIELHLPGYQYCGPGTRLKERLKRGDPGINLLDQACKEHDVIYSKTRGDSSLRREADQALASKAWSRVKSRDASVRERLAALAVAGIMKAKTKLGAGTGKGKGKIRRKAGKSLSTVIRGARAALKRLASGASTKQAAVVALKAARQVAGGSSGIGKRRIIPVPKKVGGILPLIPLFAGLLALGSLAGGAAGVVNAVNKVKKARDQLAEMQRHNHVMEEEVALRGGKGLYLAPYKKGLGLYL